VSQAAARHRWDEPTPGIQPRDRGSAPRRASHIHDEARPRHLAAVPAGERRTIVITGRGAPAPAPRTRRAEAARRPPRRLTERAGPNPDRIALWAVLLGLFLILVAVVSAHAG
jgi:hypothetical protein